MCVMIKNYVNQKNWQNVSYTINPDHRQIELYITRDRKVIVVGTADNNYIFWLSVSACEDEAATGEAFDQITRQEWDTHTALYLALKEAGFDYEDLAWMYHDRIVQSKQPGMAWSTPFGHCYGTDDADNGKFFVHDIAGFPDILETKCRIRAADGLYFPVLKEYLRILEDGDDPLYYMSPDVRAIHEILKQEQYLILAEDIKVREYYHAAAKKEAELYNRYMTAVR